MPRVEEIVREETRKSLEREIEILKGVVAGLHAREIIMRRALREIEDTEWNGIDSGDKIVGPDDIARAALAEVKTLIAAEGNETCG